MRGVLLHRGSDPPPAVDTDVPVIRNLADLPPLLA
jgi:hypothetical protein